MRFRQDFRLAHFFRLMYKNGKQRTPIPLFFGGYINKVCPEWKKNNKLQQQQYNDCISLKYIKLK